MVLKIKKNKSILGAPLSAIHRTKVQKYEHFIVMNSLHSQVVHNSEALLYLLNHNTVDFT